MQLHTYSSVQCETAKSRDMTNTKASKFIKDSQKKKKKKQQHVNLQEVS